MDTKFRKSWIQICAVQLGSPLVQPLLSTYDDNLQKHLNLGKHFDMN